MAKTYFRQHLPALFEKIELGKPVHYKRFRLGLAESGIFPNEIDQILKVENIGKHRYRVTVLPNCWCKYKEIKELACEGLPAVSQKAIAAADGGRSHSKSASGMLAIMHTDEWPDNPQCIVIENGAPRTLLKQKRKLLIIENLELFVFYKQIMDYVNRRTPYKVDLVDTDVLYGQGSTILNKQYRPLISSYEQVYCLFDVDFGGLIIYDNIRRYQPNTKFLLPDNFIELIDAYGFELPAEERKHLKQLRKAASTDKTVRNLTSMLLSYARKVEQEVYLLDD